MSVCMLFHIYVISTNCFRIVMALGNKYFKKKSQLIIEDYIWQLSHIKHFLATFRINMQNFLSPWKYPPERDNHTHRHTLHVTKCLTIYKLRKCRDRTMERNPILFFKEINDSSN